MAGAGGLVLVEMETAFPGTHTPSEIWRTRRDLQQAEPAPNERSAVAVRKHLSYESNLKWWEVLVMLQFVASDFVLRHPIYSRAAGSLPGGKAEVGRKKAEVIYRASRQTPVSAFFILP